MKKHIYKLLLQADLRGEPITYKEFVGHKVFLGNPNPITQQIVQDGKTATKTTNKTFIKTVTLYDQDTKQYRKQTVWLRVVEAQSGIAVVEVI